MTKGLKDYQKQNIDFLIKYFELEAGKSLNQDLHNQFVECIKDNKSVGINVQITPLFEILNTKKYLNIFELGYSQDQIRTRYNTHQPYFNQFMKFVEMFDQKREVKYGALNIGDMGSDYIGFGSGQICIVLKNNFIQSLDRLFCLKRFSLSYYTSTGKFREKRFRREISSWSDVQFLAYFKHLIDIDNYSFDKWPQLLSNKRGWLEVLIYNDILLHNFEEIRINKDYFGYLEKLLLTSDSALHKYDKKVKKQYALIKEMIQDLNLRLTEYDA